MRKKYFIIPIIACLLLPLLVVLTPSRGTKPFQDLTASEIADVSVQLLPPDVTLSLNNTDIDRLVSILHTVVIYNKDNSYGNYNGQAVVYTITKIDGTQTVVQAYNPFLIIDGTGYQTKYEPCEELNRLGNEIMNKTNSLFLYSDLFSFSGSLPAVSFFQCIQILPQFPYILF